MEYYCTDSSFDRVSLFSEMLLVRFRIEQDDEEKTSGVVPSRETEE